MLVTNLDYDEHKGRISIGRISKGRVVKGDQVVLAKPGMLSVCSSLFSFSLSLPLFRGSRLCGVECVCWPTTLQVCQGLTPQIIFMMMQHAVGQLGTGMH